MKKLMILPGNRGTLRSMRTSGFDTELIIIEIWDI